MKHNFIPHSLFLIAAALMLFPAIFVSAQSSAGLATSSGAAAPVQASVAPRAPAGIAPALNSAPNTISRPMPRAIPSRTPRASATSAPSGAVGAVSVSPTNTSPTNNINFGLIALVTAAGVAVLGFFGLSQMKKSGQNEKQQKDENRCSGIKELLDQKKQDLEDMVKGWPEEKIKEISKKKVLGELKKNEDAKKIIEIAEDVKEKYDQLKDTVEKLQKKYDLCMLELPSASSTLKFYVARHGQDEDNANGILNGRRDKPLTEQGIEQAKELAAKIKAAGIRFDKVYSSPLQRASRTAEIISDALELKKPEIVEDLTERDFGIMTGRTLGEIKVMCAPDILETQNVCYFLSPEGAETFPQLVERAKKLLGNLKAKHKKGNILLVTHGNFGKMLYAAYYDLDWKEVLKMFYFGNSELLELSEESGSEKTHVFKN